MSQRSKKQQPLPPSPVTYVVIGFCAFVVLLHVWGAVHPIHENWGVHFFGFYNPIVSVAALAVLVLLAAPNVQLAVVERFETMLRAIARLPLGMNLAIVLGIVIGAAFLFPAKLHLLGDGAILLRSVPLGMGSNEISQSFRNQPLMFWIYRWAMNLHPVDASPNPYTVYFTIDIIAAVVFVGLMFWSIRSLHLPLVETVLAGLLIFFGAGSQFFFGYVENYVMQYVATAAFCITGWFALERRVSVVVPVLCFVLMAMLHLGDLVFLPSLFVLILLRWRKNWKRAVLIIGAAAVVGVGVLFAIGFNFVDLTKHLHSESTDFLQPFSTQDGRFPYPMFSPAHLLDWLNSNFLMVPFGLFLSIVFVSLLPSDRRWTNPILIFLGVTATCGMCFTWIIHSALGLARDWDLFSSFFVPLLILPVYFLSQPTMLSPKQRYLLVLVVVVAGFHWASWIGVNASAEHHLARMLTLDSPIFLSRGTQLGYDEALANYFFDSQQYSRARPYYEHYMSIDPNNPRIVGNIADVYRKMGEKDLYFRMLLRAVEMKSPDPGVYSNLGVEYANRGDTAAAIAYNEKAIQISPTMQKAYANLGILYSNKNNYPLADKYFTTAINLGMREPLLFRYAGDVCIRLNDYPRALQNYDTYLSAVPNDQNARTIRDRLSQALQINQPR